ncbi:MAG: L-threonylcarbamoyladenylate synthase [Candidatus Nezhaarchaeales archaeon]
MVKILKVNPLNPEPEVINEAARLILNDSLVIYPTDTVYGLGANPLREEAVIKAFKAKRRESKPMPIIVSSVEAAERVVTITEAARKLINNFWPGALTLVLPRKPSVPSIVTAGREGLGVRMPNHAVALALARACGGLILGTSANISGNPPPVAVEEALKDLGRSVDLALDAGRCRLGLPSTVIDLTGSQPLIVREGAISRKVLLPYL